MQHPILMYGLSVVYGLFAAAFIYLWYRLCRKNAQAPKVQTCTRQAPHVFVSCIGWDENNPEKSLSDLVGWECTIALDPRVSEAAAKLLEKSAWNKVADVEPPSDRAVFTWHETCGLFYCSYWNSETKSFDLAWKPTYWMERPTNPVSPDSPRV